MFKINMRFVFIINFLVCALGHSQEKARVCILNFERRIHPLTKHIKQVFEGYSDLRIVHEAKPSDINTCISDGVEELVIIAHSLSNDAKTEHVNLGWFLELTGKEREQKIADTIGLLEKQISSLQILSQSKHAERLKRPLIPKNQDSRTTEDLKIYKLNKALNFYKNFPADRPFYATSYIDSRVFATTYALLGEQSAQGQMQLKKIRLMSCLSQKIMMRYPTLRKIAADFNVEMDLAPSSAILSWMSGHEVTSMSNTKWLRKSLTQQP